MAKIDRDTGVIKAIIGDELNLKQLEELMQLTDVDLVTEYGMSHDEAERAMNFVKREMYRMRAQGYSFGDLDADQRKAVSYPKPPTRTNPVYESESKEGKRLTEGELKEIIKQALLNESPMAGAMPLIGIGALGGAPMSARPMAAPAPAPTSGRGLDYKEPKEGRMMKANLYNIAQDAMQLCDMLHDDDDLPQWTHEKVATARDRLNYVREYLEAKIAKQGK